MLSNELKLLIRSVVVPIFFISNSIGAQPPPHIAEIKVRLFLQYSGEFSSPLGRTDILWNVMAGGGNFPEPANSLLVDVVVSGISKTYVASQDVNLLVTNERTGKLVERQNAQARVFGSSGVVHVGFWLRSVNCEPLRLVASIGGASTTLNLPFKCGE